MTDDFRPRVETDPAVMAAFDEAESRPASLENLTPRAAVRHGAAALVSVFSGSSWDTWKVMLKAIYALPMSEADIAVFQQLTGRQTPPTTPVREVWFLLGRRAGKSIMTALIAVYQTTCRTYKLAPGEVGTFMVFAADRRQGREPFGPTPTPTVLMLEARSAMVSCR